MTSDQLKLVEQAAQNWAAKMSDAPDKDFPDWVIADFKAGAAFYEQKILPEVMKEKDEKIRKNEMNFDAFEELCDENKQLASQLSQLQSSMEEEKRKAFEAGRTIIDPHATTPLQDLRMKYRNANDYLKSSIQKSTEGK